MTDERTFTARDLLLQFFDLRGLSPVVKNWNEEALADNPPRLYRLQQLMALFRAYDVPWDPEAFMEGTFIETDHPRYRAVLSELTDELRESARDRAGAHQLPDFFKTLFRYRSRVNAVLSFSNGVMAASGLYHCAHHKAEGMNSIIRANVSIIDDTLVALVSPDAATFTTAQLVQDYGYPDIDLSEIDLAWW